MERGEGSNQFPNTGGRLIGKYEETGNSEVVSSVLSSFDAVRRRLIQVGTVHGEVLETLRIFKNRGLFTNNKKRVGSIPGVGVGDIFFLRGEMDLVGLHKTNFGVDFIAAEESEENKQIAISVLSSGENADGNEDPNSLVFTGLGGTTSDQTLKGMNLSLETAFQKKSIVRVTRSKKDEKRTNGTIFIYDGIYRVTTMWEEEGRNGFKVFKFKLVREPDQKPAFGIWKSVEQWKNCLITRPGLILQDLSSGAENLKVALVNEVDQEKGPALFIYVSSLKHAVIINTPPMVDCCTCRPRQCDSRNGICACVERNFGGLPYVERVLVTRQSIVFECGGSCRCSVGCKNKMIQTGLKFNFEVFKTVDCGWGLRSWDPIRAGSFICEYAGDIIAECDEKEEDDDYIFDGSHVFKSFKWNYEPELVSENASARVSENYLSSSLVISAKKSGNIARFMNHSCSPNVLWQLIAREQNGLWCTYIGFFAMKHIPPLTELRYDYGASREGGKKMCLCRSNKCSGSFG